MPSNSMTIISACQQEDIEYLSEIDHEGTLLIEKMTKVNEDALYS